MADKEQEKKSLMEQYREGQENAFIREVKAEASRERFEKIWHKYKYIIIALVVIPIIAAMAISAHNDRSRRVAQEEASAFSEIANITEPSVRIERALEFASSARSIYRDIAYQMAYMAQLESNATEAAIATLRMAIRNARDASFRSAAIIKLSLEPNYENVKEKKRLLGSIGRRDPLYHIARLTLALINAREGNDTAALRILDNITSDRNAPNDIREQAGAMSEYLKTRKMI
jgi:hypothetical protein